MHLSKKKYNSKNWDLKKLLYAAISGKNYTGHVQDNLPSKTCNGAGNLKILLKIHDLKKGK